MPNPITVKDRTGAVVVRHDGILRDGDSVERSLHMMDSLSRTTALTDEAIRTAGKMILGDEWNDGVMAGLSGDAARHAIVRARLGDVANGKTTEFLDGAWKGLQPVTAAPPAVVGLTDAKRAVSQIGIQRALADHAKRNPFPLDVARAARDGALAAREHLLGDAWKGDDHKARDRLFDGLSYCERIGVQSGSRASQIKATDRKVSDDEFYRRQKAYRDGGNAA